MVEPPDNFTLPLFLSKIHDDNHVKTKRINILVGIRFVVDAFWKQFEQYTITSQSN